MFFCKLNLSVNFISPTNSPIIFLPFCYRFPSVYLAKSYSNMNRKDYNQIQSTQASDKYKKTKYKRASQSTSNQGSVTVEAALIIPFTFFVLYAILSISQFLLTEDRIHGALVETGRALAEETVGSITLVRAQVELQKRVKNRNLTMVSGGVAGISLYSSKLPNDRQEIELHASYRMKLSIPFLFTVTVPVHVTVIQRVFDGYQDNNTVSGNEGKYVYVAEYESVYHTDPQCSHIAIRLVPITEVSNLTGKHQCKICKQYQRSGEYVTLAGDCIHQNPQCRGIKRTIHLEERDKLGNLPLCSRCAGKR